jgi:hypothetical protein
VAADFFVAGALYWLTTVPAPRLGPVERRSSTAGVRNEVVTKPNAVSLLAEILQQRLSKSPELASKQRRLLELLAVQQAAQQQESPEAENKQPEGGDDDA